MESLTYNREAWDRAVDMGNRWSIPASPGELAAARRGELSIVLTPRKVVPGGGSLAKYLPGYAATRAVKR